MDWVECLTEEDRLAYAAKVAAELLIPVSPYVKQKEDPDD